MIAIDATVTGLEKRTYWQRVYRRYGIGARGEDLMFTSNNTARSEFETAAADGGCILNLDDISLVPSSTTPSPNCDGASTVWRPPGPRCSPRW